MPETTAGSAAARPAIEVGGAALGQRATAALRSATVDTDCAGPDSCRLVFDDPARDLLATGGLDLAADLRVLGGRVGEEIGEEIFDGVVYAVGFDFDERGAFTTITAYDRSYALYNGVRTRTYQNVTDSDLAAGIADEMGLAAGRIDATTIVHQHVAQVNETYVAFLSRRAREVDRVLRVTGGRLDFAERTQAADAPDPGDLESAGRLQLVAGSNVQRLSVRISAAQQVEEVQVRGWDPATKAAVVSVAPPRTRTAEMADTPASLAQRLGGPRLVGVDHPLTQQAECDALAAARAEHVASAHVHAEGVAYGDPRILAGVPVSLGATGGRFDGRVTVTRATHTWDTRGYHTTFVASGSHDRSVLGLLRTQPGPGHGRIPGLVVAVVTNVSDPEKAARVKVRFPWLDDDYESDWTRVLQLGAGPGRGLHLLPEVDDEVLVGFEHGDTRRPYVLGGLYNGVDAPPRDDAVDSGSGEVTARVWRSRTGHEVVLDDTPGGGAVVVRTAQGTASVTLDAASGALLVETEGDVAITAKGGVTMTADGDLTLESRQNVVIKGSQIKLN